MADIIDIEHQDEVFVLRWHDGENRFNRASVDAWNAALDTVEAAEGPRALVVVGEGKYWSNGLDLDWMRTSEEGMTFLDDVHRRLGRMIGFGCITVAALNGHAFAAGAMLSAAMDLRVMRDDRGYWCLPEADLGLPLTPIMDAVITAKLPRVTAHEAILTGRRYPAPDALAAGIVHATAPEAEVLDRAVALARANAGKLVVDVHKRQLFGSVLDLVAALDGP